jgi:hypothetical protein
MWEYETEEPSEVTLKELTGLCSELKEKRAEKKAIEDQAKEVGSRIAKIEAKILAHLEEYGMKNFSGDFGQVVRTKRYSVKQPKTPEAKEQFFDYLRSQGVFEELISVNSRTLQSWVRQEIEAKKEEGVQDFVPPGLDQPEITETISLRKA